MLTKKQVEEAFKELQDEICNALAAEDGGAAFQEDAWERPGGGGGRTRILQDGAVIEKGGVNFSAVYGSTPERILQALNLPEADFFATGVSIVQHPKSPLVPIIHMNVRYFEMSNGVWWFGGGIDLTPHYVDKAQAKWFHEQLKAVCDKHNVDFYPKFKKWADDYFYVKHRKETRGVGGIFFDHIGRNDGMSKEEAHAFVMDVGRAFAPIYVHLMHENKSLPFDSSQTLWQEVRRGRYVEFNLVLDKGTKFGLETDGRTESILMSLPPRAQWHYAHTPAAGSPEAETLSLLKKDIDWVNLSV